MTNRSTHCRGLEFNVDVEIGIGIGISLDDGFANGLSRYQ